MSELNEMTLEQKIEITVQQIEEILGFNTEVK